MTGVGRSTRVGSKPPPPKCSAPKVVTARARLVSRTAPTATSKKKTALTAMQTRSLTPLASARGRGRGRGRPAALTAAALARTAAPLTSHNDKKSGRRGRRPKFQDNPSAPEIVEKKELQSETTNKDEDLDTIEVGPAANGFQANDNSEEVNDELAGDEMVNKL